MTWGRGGAYHADYLEFLSSWEEVLDLIDEGLSALQVRLIMLLRVELFHLNHGSGEPDPLWVNIVSGVSIKTLAARAKSTEEEVEEALRGLVSGDCGDYIEWLQVAGGEDERIDLCHKYKLPSPTDREVAEQNHEIREKQRAHEEELRIQRKERKRRKAEKAARGAQ